MEKPKKLNKKISKETELTIEILEAKLKAIPIKDLVNYLKNLKNRPTGFSKGRKDDIIKIIIDGIAEDKWTPQEVQLTIIDRQMELVEDFIKSQDQIDFYSLAKKFNQDLDSTDTTISRNQFLTEFRAELFKNESIFNKMRKKFPSKKKRMDPDLKMALKDIFKEEADRTRVKITQFNELWAAENRSLIKTLTQIKHQVIEIEMSVNKLFQKTESLERRIEEYQGIIDLPTFLEFFHRHSTKQKEISAKYLTQLLSEMQSKGWNNQEIINSAAAVVSFVDLMNIVMQLSWEVDIEKFFQTVKKSHKSLASSLGSSVIAEVRKDVRKNLNISEEEFNKKILQGRDMNWFILSSAAPLGVKNPEFLIIGSNKFYYLKLKRK